MLLNYYGNYLIIFPDHHAIIWRWGKYRDLFSWPADTLKTERCKDYATSTEMHTRAGRSIRTSVEMIRIVFPAATRKLWPLSARKVGFALLKGLLGQCLKSLIFGKNVSVIAW